MNVKTAVRNIAFAAVTLTALGFTVSNAVADSDSDTPKVQTTTVSSYVPECEYEDGSTQAVCVHDDGTGDPILNVDYGVYTYNLRTNEMKAY
jgi:hypothetical protein